MFVRYVCFISVLIVDENRPFQRSFRVDSIRVGRFFSIPLGRRWSRGGLIADSARRLSPSYPILFLDLVRKYVLLCFTIKRVGIY